MSASPLSMTGEENDGDAQGAKSRLPNGGP